MASRKPYVGYRVISVKIPEEYLEALDMLVSNGFYPSRVEAVRIAIKDFFRFKWRRFSPCAKKPS